MTVGEHERHRGESPREDRDLDDEERAQDVRVGEVGGDANQRLGGDPDDEHEESQQHRHEEEGRAAAPADQDVAEPGDDGREDGGGVAK